VRVAVLSRGAWPLHEPGGLERAVFHLATHLRALGVETLLLTRPACRDGAFPGEVRTVPYGSGRIAHGRVLDRTLRYPRFAARLGGEAADLVRRRRIDVVHAHGLAGLGYARLRRRDPGLTAPLLMNPHGMEEHKATGLKRLALLRLRALSREAARLADRVVATDEAMRGEVERLLGVPASRVAVLPNGVDVEEIARETPGDAGRHVRAAFPSLAEASPLLLSVGRIEAYKGYGDVLDALGHLDAGGGLPPRWVWAVVGEGSFGAALERRARALGSRLVRTGRVDDALLHALYARADVFVHAPRYEGSSLVTLEAMAHGLPVVATRAGGIPDKVEDGVTGRLVDAGDVAGLAAALAELAADAALRRRLGDGGRTAVLERFQWPRIAERTRDLYAELLSARAA
jgi:glycogen synthase